MSCSIDSFFIYGQSRPCETKSSKFDTVDFCVFLICLCELF